MRSAEAMNAYLAALEEERALWVQVRSMIPGTPGHDEEVWNRWSAAADRTYAASRTLREALEAERVKLRATVLRRLS
jgi:hypothetical protein